MAADPNGKGQHEPGAKLDAGKPRAAMVLGGFARALWKIAEVGTFGAMKYTDNGWQEVENGEARYDDAGMRHWLLEHMGEQADPESEMLHAAHDAWNALARLDLMLREAERAPRTAPAHDERKGQSPACLGYLVRNPLDMCDTCAWRFECANVAFALADGS